MNPKDLLYAKTHEWVHVEEVNGQKIATMGISAFAVEALKDLAHLELPEVGKVVTAGEPLGEIESIKSVSDIYSPVTGEVVEVHSDLPDNLDSLHDDAYAGGWIAKLKITEESSLKELLDQASYQKLCAEES